MKKFKIRYIIFIAAFLFLTLNEGSRTLIRRTYEKSTLKSAIKNAQYQNSLLKKRIVNLENEPDYFERAARRELHVIAPGEIEYRFKSKAEEAEKKEEGKKEKKQEKNKEETKS